MGLILRYMDPLGKSPLLQPSVIEALRRFLRPAPQGATEDVFASELDDTFGHVLGFYWGYMGVLFGFYGGYMGLILGLYGVTWGLY